MAVEVVCPSDHKKVYGGVPPVGDEVAVPSHPPKHKGGVLVMFATSGKGEPMEKNTFAAQPFTSVTLSV